MDTPRPSSSWPSSGALASRMLQRSGRFLAALEPEPVEALRELFLKDVCSRPLEKEEPAGGLWDRQGTVWRVFDVDGRRQAAGPRALPQTDDRPAARRRMSPRLCAGLYGRHSGRSRANKDGRGTSAHASGPRHVLRSRKWRLPGRTGAGQIRDRCLQASPVSSTHPSRHPSGWDDRQWSHRGRLSGFVFVMRGKEDHLLDLPEGQARLLLPPDALMRHPETGMERALFDLPCLPATAAGESCRVVVATHPTTTNSASERFCRHPQADGTLRCPEDHPLYPKAPDGLNATVRCGWCTQPGEAIVASAPYANIARAKAPVRSTPDR
jgi:hypothetical protein